MFVSFTKIFILSIFLLLYYTSRLTWRIVIAFSILLFNWFSTRKIAHFTRYWCHIFMILGIIDIILIIENDSSLSAHPHKTLSIRFLDLTWTIILVIILFNLLYNYFFCKLAMEFIDLFLQICIFFLLSLSFHCMKLSSHLSMAKWFTDMG